MKLRLLSLVGVGMLVLSAVACSGGESEESDDGKGSDSGGDGDGDGDSTGDGDGDAAGDGDGDATGDGDGDATGDGDGSLGNACDPSDESGDDCPGYVTCVKNKCSAAYKTCLGAGYESGQFSGGTCEDYMNCVSKCNSGGTCDENCAAECTMGSACQTCLANEVTDCVFNECSAELGACFEVDLPDFETGGGCAELEACCASLEGDAKTSCDSLYDSVSATGDVGCGTVLSTYIYSGQCE